MFPVGTTCSRINNKNLAKKSIEQVIVMEKLDTAQKAQTEYRSDDRKL